MQTLTLALTMMIPLATAPASQAPTVESNEPAAAVDKQEPAAFAPAAAGEAPVLPATMPAATPTAPAAGKAEVAPTVPWPSVNQVDNPEASSAPNRPSWRLLVSVGSQNKLGDSAKWLDDAGRPAARVRVEYSLDSVVPGLSLHLGGSLWRRGEASSPPLELSLMVVGLDAGVIFQWPRDGLFDWLYPYARASALVDYLKVRTNGGLGDDLFVPGLEAAVGLRMHLGRHVVTTRGSGKSEIGGRFFAFGEVATAMRLPAEPKLSVVDVDDNRPLIAGPATSLGELSLSGWSWMVGVGVTF